ncbi:MAG: nitrogenase component 1 [Methanomicrobiales archaeon]|nr:nitrogenase component 1 [Methanomicrobiales archaeon]
MPEKQRAFEIPRKTCRLFGVVKALGTMRKCAILVHGPRGCVYHINYILGMRGDRPSAIYTTALDERGVIFGSERELVRAIEEIDRTIKPELIAVLSCCASSIIGEDVEQAAKEARTTARVISFEAGGFEGDFRTGYSAVLSRIAEEIAREPERIDPRAVNLLGLLRAGPDLRELKELMALLGLRVNAVLTAGSTRGEMERLGEAALNVVVCETAGREAAETLRRRFGTPFIAMEFPIGYRATRQFLRRVADTLGIEAPDLPDEEPEADVDLSGTRIAVVGGPTRTLAMCRFLKELRGSPVLVVLDSAPTEEAMDEMRSLAGKVLLEPGQQEIVDALGEEKIDLLIGGMLEKPLAALLKIPHIDIMHGSQKTVGLRGLKNLLSLLSEQRKREG